MSYLHLPALNLGDFSTGTISLWFRFSSDSVEKAIAHSNSYPRQDGVPTILKGVIPFVTFGRVVPADCYTYESRLDGTPPPGIGYDPAYSLHYIYQGQEPSPPSHIGLDCSRIPAVTLVMFFQTETRATVQGLAHEVVSVEWKRVPGGESYQIYTTYKDVSYVRVGQPESFLINPTFNVAEDQWHHLLLSFDFSGSVDVVAISVPPGGGDDVQEGDTITSSCKFWYALDDENKNAADLGDAWTKKDDNGVTTQTSWQADGTYTPVNDPTSSGRTQNPEYHWAASPLPVKDGAMGLPASDDHVETIYHCEMADFQFFAGLQIDTSDESKRRAFVGSNGEPVTPEETEKKLGRRPDILLRGTSKWQDGKNTGSTGQQFTPVAWISPYKPDPDLSP